MGDFGPETRLNCTAPPSARSSAVYASSPTQTHLILIGTAEGLLRIRLAHLELRPISTSKNWKDRRSEPYNQK